MSSDEIHSTLQTITCRLTYQPYLLLKKFHLDILIERLFTCHINRYPTSGNVQGQLIRIQTS